MSAARAPAPEPPARVDERPRWMEAGLAALRGIPVVWALLLILRLISFLDELPHPEGFRHLKTAAPLAILAIGAYLCSPSGEFDLGRLAGDGDRGRRQAVDRRRRREHGAGDLRAVRDRAGRRHRQRLCTTILRVPSFIVTPAMLLILNGAVFLWTGGATGRRPGGQLPRRRPRGDRGLPGARGASLLGDGADRLRDRGRDRRSRRLRRRVLAVGDNDRAAALSGVNVARVRTVAFVISATSAVIAGESCSPGSRE